MTERSTFSATKGIKQARKNNKSKQQLMQPDFHIPPVETKKFQPGFGGVDGSQIMPPRNTLIQEKERPPLHLPKKQVEKKKVQPPIVPKKKSISPVAPQVQQPVEESDPKDLVDQ